MCVRRREIEDDLTEFHINVRVAPDLNIDIQGKNPCDVLELSGPVIRRLREMGLEPKAQVMNRVPAQK